MRQSGRCFDLSQKSWYADDSGELRAKDLQCDQSVVLDASSEIHRRARTTTKLTLDLVRSLERLIEIFTET